MAKVRVRADTKKLFIDFQYQGVRCREQTLMADTPRNRKQLETLIQRMDAKILLGNFDYAEFFPGSKNLEKLAHCQSGNENLVERAGLTLPFPDFADQWFQEYKIQWRNSHARNVDSILIDILPHLYRWGIPLQSARGQLITRLAGSCC